MNKNETTETKKPVNGFTPGPWLALKGSFQGPDRWIVVSGGGKVAYVIASIENGAPGDTLETEGHTAHLVAAAPDLYAALKNLAAQVQQDLDDINMTRRSAGKPECGNDELDAAHAALKKALGSAK